MMQTPISTKAQREQQALESARAQAHNRIKQGHAETLKALTDRYPATEREGWHELIADAKAGEGDCLRTYADSMGISESEAATRILGARDGYRKAYGEATGKLTRLRDAVDAAETLDELEAIQW